MSVNLSHYIDGTLLYHEGSYNFMRQFVGNLGEKETRIIRNEEWSITNKEKLNQQLFEKVVDFASTSKALMESESKPYFTLQNFAIFVGGFDLSFLLAALKLPYQYSDELARNFCFTIIAVNAGIDVSSGTAESVAAAVLEFLDKTPFNNINFKIPDPMPAPIAKAETLFKNDFLRRHTVTVLLFAFAGAIMATALTVFMRIKAHDNLLAKLNNQAAEIKADTASPT